MASIEPNRRGPGYVVRWRDEAGKQRKKLFKRKLDADRFKAQIEHQLHSGTYIDPAAGRQTLGAYAEAWLVAQPHRFSTGSQKRSQLDCHILPALGDRPLASLRHSTLQAFVTGLDLSPSSVRPVWTTLRAVIGAAVRDRLIPYDPCDGVHMPELPHQQIVPLTVEQVEGLAAEMDDRHRALVEVDAATGLRQGELFGLEVSDVDFLRRTVRVERQVQRTKDGRALTPLKNKASYRVVPVGQVVIDALAAHLAAYPVREAVVLDTTSGRPVQRTARLVFARPDGAPLSRSGFNAGPWDRARQAAGLPDAGMHDLRHFFASALIRAGLNPKVVAARLGHANAAITLRVYSHLWPDDDDRSRDAIDEIFGRKIADDVPRTRPARQA